MYEACYLIGEPKKFPGFTIYPPTVKDVIKEPNFYVYMSLLTKTQLDMDEQFKDVEAPPTPFEYLLGMALANEQNMVLICSAIEFFVHETVLPLQVLNAFFVGDPQSFDSLDDIRTINKDNFSIFQNEIRDVCGLKRLVSEEENESYKDMDPRLRKMKAARRRRDQIKAQAQAKNGGSISFSTNLVAIFSMGLGITPLNIGDISYTAIQQITRGCQEKEVYDTQIRAMTSGFGVASGTKQPTHWINQIQNS